MNANIDIANDPAYDAQREMLFMQIATRLDRMNELRQSIRCLERLRNECWAEMNRLETEMMDAKAELKTLVGDDHD